MVEGWSKAFVDDMLTALCQSTTITESGRDGSCDCVGLVYPQLAVGYSARPAATVIVVVRSRDTRRPLAHSGSHGRCLKASFIHIAYQLFRNTYVAPCTIPPRRWRVSETQLRLLSYRLTGFQASCLVQKLNSNRLSGLSLVQKLCLHKSASNSLK